MKGKKGFEKGKSGNPKGKPKGAENKINKDIKEAYQMLIEKNIDNLALWLDRIAEKEPEKAFKLIIELSEYILPKQARIEADITQDSLESEKMRIRALFPDELEIKDIKSEK